jgi:hypothetical protein
MNPSLEYLADSLIIEALAKDDIKITAQDIIGSVASGVKEYVESQFDKERPVSSITAFLGSGLLWSMGFKWMSVLYSVAEALGFDWKTFWSAVGKNITDFVRDIINSGNKSSESDATTKINGIVGDAFINNFTGAIDKEKLTDIVKQRKFGNDLNNALEIKAFATNNQNIIKEAGVLSIFKGKLARFFIRTISWLVKTALISLGFVSATGAVKGLIGYKPSEDNKNSPIYNLKVSPDVPEYIFTAHPNDLSNVWIERGDINNISDIIKSWILLVYPQLQSKINNISNSSSFLSMIDKFNQRNRLATGLDLISIPRPYQKKSEIVSEIVNGYLSMQPNTNTDAYV